MHIHCLKNVATEGLGLIEHWAQINNHTYSYTSCYTNPRYPNLENIDLLVVAGGPMGVHDELEYPWLEREKSFLKKAINSGTVILGICLGAQLLANLLGARVYQNSHQEIGWMPVEQISDHSHSPFLDLDREFEVMHWHGDTYELPEGAINLVKSEACSNQAFIYDNHVLGLQFHIELTQSNLTQLCENSLPEPDIYVQTADEIIGNPKHLEQLKTIMNRIMTRLEHIATR